MGGALVPSGASRRRDGPSFKLKIATLSIRTPEREQVEAPGRVPSASRGRPGGFSRAFLECDDGQAIRP
jgi:hypothetical protein